MTSKWILTIAVCFLVSDLLLGQDQAPNLPPAPANARTPSISSPDHPELPALIATCTVPPSPRGGGRGGAAPPAPTARGAPPQQGPRAYTVTEIPGVIAAGKKWKFLWQEAGNNGDGIVGTDDGALLIAQNDNSEVLRLDQDGNTSVVYPDTRTGGSLSINSNGDVFIVQRALRSAIFQLAPVRKVLADRYQGDVLDCVGGNPNDVTANSKGGAYFTQGGVYHADPNGVVTKYGEDIRPNGIVLSADEQILYVTNRQTLAAFDVRPDGSLTNQREFATLDGGGNGDGLAIDDAGRIYVTSNPGVQVISPDGEYLGIIPTPRGVISVAFGGNDKRTLFVLARGAIDADGNEVRNAAQVYSIAMTTQGYRGRAK